MIKRVVLNEQIRVDTDFINDYVENKKFDGIKTAICCISFK